MVKPRLNTIEQVNELIAHGAHAIDVDLVKDLLQIIFAQQHFNYSTVSEQVNTPELRMPSERPHVVMIDDFCGVVSHVAEQKTPIRKIDPVFSQLLGVLPKEGT